MYDDFFARVKDRPSESERLELRISACIIGNGNPIDLRTVDEFGGEGTGLDCALLSHRAADGHQLCCDQKAGGIEQFFAQGLHRHDGTTLFIRDANLIVESCQWQWGSLPQVTISSVRCMKRTSPVLAYIMLTAER